VYLRLPFWLWLGWMMSQLDIFGNAQLLELVQMNAKG
jgi:hypothetical protein